MIVVGTEFGAVVVNYRTPADLNSFMDSWHHANFGMDSELVVMDVDPTEESEYEAREFLSKYDFPFIYYKLDTNVGYSGACNFGSTLIDPNIYGFFNADTKLYRGTVDTCFNALCRNEDWGILGPLQVDSQGRATHAGIFGTNRKPQHRGWKSGNLEGFRDVREAVTVSGSAYFVKRATWFDVWELTKELYPDSEGAFLPTPHYYEETWVSYAARHKDWKVMYFGEAVMEHEWHQASKVGEVEKLYMPTSRQMFRDACDHFGIERD